MSSVVSYTLDGEIGVIAVNNPPVNALGQAVRAGNIGRYTAAATTNGTRNPAMTASQGDATASQKSVPVAVTRNTTSATTRRT